METGMTPEVLLWSDLYRVNRARIGHAKRDVRDLVRDAVDACWYIGYAGFTLRHIKLTVSEMLHCSGLQAQDLRAALINGEPVDGEFQGFNNLLFTNMVNSYKEEVEALNRIPHKPLAAFPLLRYAVLQQFLTTAIAENPQNAPFTMYYLSVLRPVLADTVIRWAYQLPDPEIEQYIPQRQLRYWHAVKAYGLPHSHTSAT